MGKIIKPKYRLECTENKPSLYSPIYPYVKGEFSIAWSGRATTNKLLLWIDKYEKSTRDSGVNIEIGPRIITSAKIIEQKTGKIILEYSK